MIVGYIVPSSHSSSTKLPLLPRELVCFLVSFYVLANLSPAPNIPPSSVSSMPPPPRGLGPPPFGLPPPGFPPTMQSQDNIAAAMAAMFGSGMRPPDQFSNMPPPPQMHHSMPPFPPPGFPGAEGMLPPPGFPGMPPHFGMPTGDPGQLLDDRLPPEMSRLLGI